MFNTEILLWKSGICVFYLQSKHCLHDSHQSSILVTVSSDVQYIRVSNRVPWSLATDVGELHHLASRVSQAEGAAFLSPETLLLLTMSLPELSLAAADAELH